jgi:hypothetical protein
MTSSRSGARLASGAALGLVAVALAANAAAETRPPAAALIAGAKRTPLDRFQVRDELKGLTAEQWLKRTFGARPVAWRATSCRSAANGKPMTASPVCVEATLRFAAGVSFTLGIGFDEKARRPQDHPNAMWGVIAIRGRHCDFLRHPDHMHEIDKSIDAMVEAGGRCQ